MMNPKPDNGKGDEYRRINIDKYESNYDRIFSDKKTDKPLPTFEPNNSSTGSVVLGQTNG